jgi:tRNA pseudouridine38-40 synthase
MPRYKLLIEYNGTRYSGWQVQQNAKSVQGAIINAARDAFGRVGEVVGSGRTDAGVHALGQVAHIDLPDAAPVDRVRYGLNDNLPYDINVLDVSSVHGRFHARHDATGRSYIYQICRRRTAFGKEHVWWIRDPLDIGAMRRASLAAIGLHDFSSFADLEGSNDSRRVVVESIDIGEFGDMVILRIRASHFLRKMVRRVVGTLVEIGRGGIGIDGFADAIDRPTDRLARYTAPPSGLFLEQVIYKGESFLPELLPAMPVERLIRS